MRIRLILALAMILSACHQTSVPDAPADTQTSSASMVSSAAIETPTVEDSASSSQETSSVEAMPSDVRAFVDKREVCEHWLGEASYDDERAKEISNALQDNCTGTDKKLSALRRKYKDQPVVLEALAPYDDKIEN